MPGLPAKLLGTVAGDTSAKAQEVSNAVWAVATLKDARQLKPIDPAVVNALCTHFLAFLNSQLPLKPATAQGVSSVLWAAATLGLKSEATMLDKLCGYLVHLVQQPSTKASVGVQ